MQRQRGRQWRGGARANGRGKGKGGRLGAGNGFPDLHIYSHRLELNPRRPSALSPFSRRRRAPPRFVVAGLPPANPIRWLTSSRPSHRSGVLPLSRIVATSSGELGRRPPSISASPSSSSRRPAWLPRRRHVGATSALTGPSRSAATAAAARRRLAAVAAQTR